MSPQIHIRMVFALLAACGLLLAQEPKGNADNGKRLFAAYACYQCHGYQGQGGNAGARLAPKPLPVAGIRQLAELLCLLTPRRIVLRTARRIFCQFNGRVQWQ